MEYPKGSNEVNFYAWSCGDRAVGQIRPLLAVDVVDGGAQRS
jgi:hypothetical protein